MDLSTIPLFALADKRLAWVNTRQAVLAQNIANADTAGFQAQDVPAFATLLSGSGMTLAVTAPGHIPGTAVAAGSPRAVPGERAPDGNSVALDKELAKVADTDMAHEFAIGVTKSYLGMFRTALGK